MFFKKEWTFAAFFDRIFRMQINIYRNAIHLGGYKNECKEH